MEQPHYMKETLSYAASPTNYMRDSSNISHHISPDSKGNNPIWNRINRSDEEKGERIRYMSPTKNRKASFSQRTYVNPTYNHNDNNNNNNNNNNKDKKVSFTSNLNTGYYPNTDVEEVNIKELIRHIDHLEVKVKRRDNHITSLTNELDKIKKQQHMMTQHARNSDSQIHTLIDENNQLRNALKDFSDIGEKLDEQENSNKLYYEGLCEEFYTFVNSIIKADSSLHNIAYEVRSTVRNSNYASGSGAILNGMRLICEKLQILLEHERRKNANLENKLLIIINQQEHNNQNIQNIVVGTRYDINNINQPSAMSPPPRTPLEKAIKTPLNITPMQKKTPVNDNNNNNNNSNNNNNVNDMNMNRNYNNGIPNKKNVQKSKKNDGNNIYMSIVARDKDALLMKKLARYKLSKLTKNKDDAQAVSNSMERRRSRSNSTSSQKSESNGEKAIGSSRLNLSVSSYPIGGL